MDSRAAAANRRQAQDGATPHARRYRRVATEEAFAIPEQLEAFEALGRSTWDNIDLHFWRGMLSNRDDPRVTGLLDLDDRRIREMDEHGVDVQILSLTSPGVQLFDPATASALARLANDRLAEAIERHPGRLAGLAALAPHDPAEAVREMKRGVNALKLNGFIINSHTDGGYLDEERFWPILEAAQALDRPIYIHPRVLPEGAVDPYRPYGLWGAVWGYAADTGLHGMRLIMSGVLDRFPKLRIVLGHMGEGIPYWVYRIDHMYGVMSARWPKKLELKPSEYLRRNFLITTSGMNHHPALKYCHEVLGPETILWAIDYPYQDTAEAVAFMDSAPLPEPDKAMIYAANADRAFRLPDAAAEARTDCARASG